MFEEEAVKHYENLTKSALRLNEIVKEQQKEIEEYQKEIEEYQKELDKADSLTQSCIFEGNKNAGKTYRQCLNMLEKQQQRIDKAIEYLEDTPRVVKSIHYRDKESNYVFIEKTIKNELLEILKGVQDERTTIE